MREMNKTFKVSDDVELSDIMFADPNLLKIFSDFLEYANKRRKTPIITGFSASDDKKGKFKTHKESSYFLVDICQWWGHELSELEKYFNCKYRSIAAILKKDGSLNAVDVTIDRMGTMTIRFKVKNMKLEDL